MKNYGKKKQEYQIINHYSPYDILLNIYTIGFTKKTANDFFESLRKSGAKHLLDIRLNNTSQLSGFTKKNDLCYFLGNLVKMEYHEIPAFAPDKSILDEYRKSKDWLAYEEKYIKLIQSRSAEKQIPLSFIEEGIVLLCSEPKATHCHRRLAAEYLKRTLPSNLTNQIEHL